MKTISTALDAHLKGDLTTLCTCWKVTRRDGQQYFFTDHDEDVLFQGDVYEAETSYMRSAVQSDAQMSVDNMEVDGVLDDEKIGLDDLRFGKFDYADVEIFLLNWANPAQGKMTLRSGKFGEVEIHPSGAFKVELRGLIQLLSQTVGDTFSPECRADFGDDRCRVALAPALRQSSRNYAVGDRVLVRNHEGDAVFKLPIVNPDFGLLSASDITGWAPVVNMELTNSGGYGGGVATYTTAWAASIEQTENLQAFLTLGQIESEGAYFTVSMRAMSKSTVQELGVYIACLSEGGAVLYDTFMSYRALEPGYKTISSEAITPPIGTRRLLIRPRFRAAAGHDETFDPVQHRSYLDDVQVLFKPKNDPAINVTTNGDFQLDKIEGNSGYGWSSDLRVLTSAYQLGPHSGETFAGMGVRTFAGNYIGFSQDIILTEDLGFTFADIDAGLYELELSWWQANYEIMGQGGAGFQFRGATGNVLGTFWADDKRCVPVNMWNRRTKSAVIPPGSRRVTIRTRATFDNSGGWHDITPTVAWDNFDGVIRKLGAGTTDYRDYGGVEYECVTAGKTDPLTPGDFSRVIDDTIQDGTVLWKAVRPKLKHIGSLTAVTDRAHFTATALAGLAANLFAYGVIEFLSGPNAGFRDEVKSSGVDGALVLRLGMPYLPQVGDQFVIQAGCDKRRATCKTFGNIINFRGEPDIPGTDQFFQVGKPT